jgi:hypothetical protein
MAGSADNWPSDPALTTVPTTWAADYLGSRNDAQIKKLLQQDLLSFKTERRRAAIPVGYLSWWEMVRLDAFEHLRTTRPTVNRTLRNGLLLLHFSLEPFAVVWTMPELPLTVAPSDIVGYVASHGASGIYDPTDLLQALGLQSSAAPAPVVPPSNHPQRAIAPKQASLFGTNEQLDLFDSE